MMSKVLFSTIKQPGLGLKIVLLVFCVPPTVEMGMGKLQQECGHVMWQVGHPPAS